uniref:Uncharacterized protein n=1 Tax=Odontella aurita TaxID=265563 RepID=A0A6U6JCU6_9STRA|eukprot:CAMPEP_0113552548 /NCGR_PEP_ID=MMETSP0015_2-20120614/15127_1 /TAXON_ID=2838 /ORGANISM="Odontella" /LENGTH=307 /DNA_ID=CAMNT_0000453535 /DNA_START=30 /DNA_END=953 /DNA_ORIENTATION=+ /assembly_acc=CAM_ASM_000160
MATTVRWRRPFPSLAVSLVLVLLLHFLESTRASFALLQMSSSSPKAAKGLVVVTGGSRGIGAATCKLLASRGYDVAVNYQSGEGEARGVCDYIDAVRVEHAESSSWEYVGRAIPIKADVSIEGDVERLFDSVESQFGRPPTGLVNNAGILGPREVDVTELSKVALDSVMATNVYGPFYCCREFVKRVGTKKAKEKGAKGGAIVNVSSGSAYTGRPLLYAMSKGALDSMMAGLSQTLPSEGIRINAVAPGVTETDMVTPQMIDNVIPLIPMGRAGKPEEIAEVIAFLLGDGGGGYCCGAKIRAAGGRP